MGEVDLDLRGAAARIEPGIEPQRRPARSDRRPPQVAASGGKQRVAGLPLAARERLHLTQFLKRVDPHLLIGPDRQPHAGIAIAQRGQDAIAEVALGRRTGDDDRPAHSKPVDVSVADMDGMHDRRPRAQETGAVQQLDRRAAVLGLALAELAPLLGSVDMADKVVRIGVPGDLSQPRSGHRPDRMRGHANPHLTVTAPTSFRRARPGQDFPPAGPAGCFARFE
jgi:hypothetical protein